MFLKGVFSALDSFKIIFILVIIIMSCRLLGQDRLVFLSQDRLALVVHLIYVIIISSIHPFRYIASVS